MMMRRLLAAAVPIALVACSSVRQVRQPMRYVTEKNPPVVHVAYVLQGVGVTVAVANPQVVGDSLKGTRAMRGNPPVAIPVRDIHAIAARRFDGRRTAILATGIGLLSALGLYAMLGTANGRDNWYCDYNDSVRGPNGEPLCGPM